MLQFWFIGCIEVSFSSNCNARTNKLIIHRIKMKKAYSSSPFHFTCLEFAN